MTKQKARTIIGLGVISLVATGCGGNSSSSTSSGTSGGVTSPSYEVLSSTAAKTSTLGGVGVASTPNREVITYAGNITHNTGAVDLAINGYNFSDPDGVNSQGRLTADDGSVAVGQSSTFSTYGYVTTYDVNYKDGDDDTSAVGFGGIITDAADMPTTGSAVYNGESVARVTQPNDGFLLTGKSKITANFGSSNNGDVQVEMTELTGSGIAPGGAESPIDSIVISGMTIEGNRFSGGTVATMHDGTEVNVIGSDVTNTTAGAFFGYDSTISAPDEVAGVLLSEGSEGSIVGQFIGD